MSFEPSARSRWLGRLDVVVAVAVLASLLHFAARALRLQWDLRVYRAAGLAALSGLDPYRLDHLAQAAGHPVPLPFVYPPIGLLPLLPLATMPLPAAQLLWVALKVAMVVTLTVVWRRRFLPDVPWTAVALVAVAGSNAAAIWDLRAGNLALIEAAILWTAFACYAEGRRAWFAALVVAAATFKLVPAAFLLLLLVPSAGRPAQPRLFAGALAALLALVAGPIGVAWLVRAAGGAVPPLLEHPLLSSLPADLPVGEANPSVYAMLESAARGRWPDAAGRARVVAAAWAAYAALLVVASAGWLRAAWRGRDAVRWIMGAVALELMLAPRPMAYGFVLAGAPLLYFAPGVFRTGAGSCVFAALVSAQGLSLVARQPWSQPPGIWGALIVLAGVWTLALTAGVRAPWRRLAPARLGALGLALAGLVVAVPAHAAAARPAPIERRFEAAVTEGRAADALATADTLVRVRERSRRLAPARAAALLDSLGGRLFRAGTPQAWAAAESLFRQALARREAALGADHPEVASSLATLSTLLDYGGRWREALPLEERALAIRLRARGERHAETATSLKRIGQIHFQLGEYDRAAAPLTRSVEIYRALGDAHRGRLADGYNNLAELARVRDRLDSAEAFFRAGLEIARMSLPAEDPVRWALGNNLAGLFKDAGRFAEAEPLLEDALAVLESAGGDAEMLATARLNLAEVRRLQGRAEEAAPLYDRALADARAALGGAHPDLVPFLNQAAVCAHALGRDARAESLYRETGAITLATLGAAHPLLAQNLHDLARLRLDAGRWGEADSLLARALAIRERSFGASHPEVALTLVERARALARDPARGEAAAATVARAIAILDSTRTYPESRLDAYALRAEGHAAAGRTGAAIADAMVALAMLDSLRAWRGGGDEARVALVASRLALYDRAVGWLLREGEVERALETHERGRARALLDQILAGGVDVRAGIAPGTLAPLAAAEEAAEAALATANRAIQSALADPARDRATDFVRLAPLESRRDSAAFALAGARRRIEEASPLWRRVLSTDGRTATTAELRGALAPAGGLLLVYRIGASESHVFVVPPRGRVEALPLVVADADAPLLGIGAGPLAHARLERLVGGAAGPHAADSLPGIAALLGGEQRGGFLALAGRSPGDPAPLDRRLHALWRTLVPPRLQKRLHGASRAVVVPDGALHAVAFEALVTAPAKGRKAVRYWLDDGPAIRYGPSAGALLALGRRARAAAREPGREPVLSVSDVAYASAAPADSTRPAWPEPAGRAEPPAGRIWSPLPATAHETAAIRAAFGAARVATLGGGAAREHAVREALRDRRYVHLATHGFLEGEGRGARSGLVLAPPADAGAGHDDDGVLELFEIHRLALDCDLAVLSACETARGPRVAGEGAYALSRAFLAAGAHGVVATLWPVDDRAAAAVVGALFGSLAASEARGEAPDAALALRDAKRGVRRDPRTADPFYWAPFVAAGR